MLAGLDACLLDQTLPPLARIRRFFEMTQESYRQEGYLGCLMGGLGQELSGVSEVFRRKIDWCLSSIAERMAKCLSEAQQKGDVPAACDVQEMADPLVNCWEGAALRSRLRRNPAALTAMLDFYISSIAIAARPHSTLVAYRAGPWELHLTRVNLRMVPFRERIPGICVPGNRVSSYGGIDAERALLQTASSDTSVLGTSHA